MVDDNVQGISHFMRDGRINKSHKFTLTFYRIFSKNFIGLINKAQDEWRIDNLNFPAINRNLLDLELFEGWQEVIVDKVHVREAFDHIFDELGDVFIFHLVIFETEYFVL